MVVMKSVSKCFRRDLLSTMLNFFVFAFKRIYEVERKKTRSAHKYSQRRKKSNERMKLAGVCWPNKYIHVGIRGKLTLNQCIIFQIVLFAVFAGAQQTSTSLNTGVNEPKSYILLCIVELQNCSTSTASSTANNNETTSRHHVFEHHHRTYGIAIAASRPKQTRSH